MAWLSNPLTIADQIFDCHQSSPQWKDHVIKHFVDNLEHYSVNIRNSIPSLNEIPLHHIKDGTVVRFRCIIQDMFNPELYVGAYEMRNKETGQTKLMCGMYRDLISNPMGYEVDVNAGRNFDDERLVYYCISVPGENSWVKTLYKKQSLLSSEQQLSGKSTGKRPQDDADEDMDVVTQPTISTETLDNQNNKRIKAAESLPLEVSTKSQDCPERYLPWPDETAVAAIVKIYDACEYSLNDVVEFVGIISMDPQLATLSPDDRSSTDSFGQLQMEEEECQNPPASLVPRLHVLKGFRMTHNNPHLSFAPEPEDLNAMASLCINVRSQLHSILENELSGDSVAADYLLCYLISSMELKGNASSALGKFSLNLTNVNECGTDFVGRFYKLLSSLVTKSVLLPASLENLNNWDLMPTKDYQANRLVSGRLQLSKQTHLIVDETVLSEGQLQTKGVRNVGALERLIQLQEVSYDFNYNKIEFQTDIPVLILSDKKSILSTSFVLPIASKENWSYRSENISHLLPDLRTYITILRLLSYNHTFDDEIQKRIADFFVEERQKDVNQMTEGILHNILNMTKLLSLSYGEKKLSVETWEKTMVLESVRKSRI